MPQILIKINRDGKVEIEGVGYIGKECLIDLNKILQALREYGIEVKIEKQELKPEYYVKVKEKEFEIVRT